MAKRPEPHHIKVTRALNRIGETKDLGRIAQAAGLTKSQASRALQAAKARGVVRRVKGTGTAVDGNWIAKGARTDGKGHQKIEVGAHSPLGRIYQGNHGVYRH